MTSQMALDLANGAILLAAKLAAPVLISTIVVGVLMNIIQTVFSIKDTSISFVPKVVVAAIVMTLSLPWAVSEVNAYFEQTYMMFRQVVP